MKRYKAASILMLIHGGFMEIGGCLCLIPILLSGSDAFGVGRYFSFIVPYLQENMYLMLAIGLLYGVMRVMGAIGLWKNKMWGLILSIINCVITMALMIFMLPAGIMDGIFACSALLLILTQYYGDKKIIEQRTEMD